MMIKLLLALVLLMISVPNNRNIVIVGLNDSDCSDGICDSIALQNVLDVADPGAVVHLKGVFDFGTDQFVSLKKDVTLKGERNQDDELTTIIKGGMNTFALGWDPALGVTEYDETCGLVSNLNTQRWPAEFVIRDLQFEQPTWSAIAGAATTGATIKNNRFMGGVQVNAGCNSYGGPLPDGAMSPVLFTTWPDARNPVLGDPSDISGQIIIKNNYFDGDVRLDPNGYDPAHGFSSILNGEPILLNGMLTPIDVTGTSASITIKDNFFENIMWGLFVSDNSGKQIIKHNTIFMNPLDEEGNPIGFVWAGISLQNTGERVENAPVVISDNYIYSRVPDFVYGILSRSKAITIKNNVLELDQTQDSLWNAFGDSAAINVAEGSVDNVVKNNTIAGSGQVGIAVVGYEAPWIAEGNHIKNNDLSEFTPLEPIDFWCRVVWRD